MEEFFDSKEEISDSDERESIIEEQDYEMDGQDFNNTDNNYGIITDDANIQYISLSPVGDGFQLPGVMEETLDANIWRQTDSSILEDSVCSRLLPSATGNRYNFFQQDDSASGFNNTNQS